MCSMGGFLYLAGEGKSGISRVHLAHIIAFQIADGHIGEV